MWPEQGSCAETLGHVLVVECVSGGSLLHDCLSEAACRLARQERVSKADISSADPRWTLRDKVALGFACLFEAAAGARRCWQALTRFLPADAAAAAAQAAQGR